MYRKTVTYRMNIHASGDTIARYSNSRMTTAAATTTTVSKNALHATRTLASLGSRARRSRSPAQRFGHADEDGDQGNQQVSINRLGIRNWNNPSTECHRGPEECDARGEKKGGPPE